MLLMLGMTFAALLTPLGTAGRWFEAHAVEITGSGVALILACRAVPAPLWAKLEARVPRLAAFFRLVRALWPDLVKAAKALYTIWTRRPWPFDPPRDGDGTGAGGPSTPYRAAPATPSPPTPSTAARVGLAACALALVCGALLASCSGSWEQRAHRALVVTAHAVAVADDTAAHAYQAEVARADGGAAFQQIDDRYRRIQGAEEALAATLVRAEALLDAVRDAGGDAGTARCLALRALVQLAADARVYRGVLTAAGVALNQDQAALAHGVAAVIDEMAPRCEGSDAGSDVVTTDAGGDDA